MRARVWGMSLVLGLMMAQPVWATNAASQSPDQFDQAVERTCCYPMLQKLGRGLANVVGSPLEIPLGMEQQYHRSNDAAAGFATGLVYGTFKGLVRLAVGVFEAFTFVMPCPKDYAPILPPLGYFKKPLTSPE